MRTGAPSHDAQMVTRATVMLTVGLLLLTLAPSHPAFLGAGQVPAAPSVEPSPSNVYDQTDIISQWYRYLDSPGHREAEAHIRSVFDDLGLNTTVQEYTANRLDGSVRAANILGLMDGVDSTRCLVIGGHYDNNQRSSRGAYDNAVGVATVIELARLLAQDPSGPPPVSVIFAAWDAEEGGGAGSDHFLEDPVWDLEIVGYINLDMFSLNWPVRNSVPMANEEYLKLSVYTSPVSDFSIYSGVDFTDRTLDNFTAFRDMVENISYEQEGYPPQWVIVQDDTVGISDHRFFVERSVPSVWLRGMHEKPREEGDINEIAFKHTPADTLETMEVYAGGKQELLAGMDTGLTLAYSLAVQWMEHVNASTAAVDDVHPPGAPGGRGGVSSGPVVGLAVLVLLMIPVVFVLWRRRDRT